MLAVMLLLIAGSTADAGEAAEPPIPALWTDGWDKDGGFTVPSAWNEGDRFKWEDDSFWVDPRDHELPADAGVAGVVDSGFQAVLKATRVLQGVEVHVDGALPGEEEKLQRFVGLKKGDSVDASTAARISQRLMDLGIHRVARCTLQPDLVLACRLQAGRVVNSYRVEGLPLLLLQRDLDRRIFLRPGERLDDGDSKAGDKVTRQRKRVEEYLQREGYFGGKVLVDTPQAGGDARAVEVVIRLVEFKWARLNRVNVKGVPRAWEGEIRQAVKGLPLVRFRPADLADALRKVELRYRTGRGYPEAHLGYSWTVNAQGTADVDVKADLGPHVDIRLVNGTPLSDESLRKHLTFAESGSIDEQECDLSARALRYLLQQRGYHSAKVTWTRTGTEKEGVLTFTLHVEGLGIIRKVEVTGTRTLSPEVVRSQARLASVEQGWLLLQARPPLLENPVVLGSRGIFTEEDVVQDVRRLEQYMTRNGFPEAVVTARRTTSAADGGILIVFHVEEGPRYLLRDVQFEGVSHLTRGELMKAVGLYPKGPFVADALQEYEATLIGTYARRGYLQSQVHALTDFDQQGRPIVKFVVTEGPRARLGAIFIEGNRRTLEPVIRRELGLREGQPMDPEKVSEAVSRLRRTGIFRRVNARFMGVSEGREDVSLVVAVEERAVRTVDGALAFSTSEYLALSLEARDRNFGGTMTDVTLRGQFGPLLLPSVAAPLSGINVDVPQNVQNVLGSQLGIRSRTLGYLGARLPHLLGTPLNLVASLEGELRDRPIPSADPDAQLSLGRSTTVGGVEVWNPFNPLGTRAYDQERFAQAGAQLGTDAVLWNSLKLGVGYGFELFARQLVTSPNARWDLGFPTRAGYLETKAAYARLDNAFDPHQGFQLNGRLRLGARPLGAEGEFLIAAAQASAYYTLWRFTFAGSARGSVAAVDGGAGNKAIVPRRDLGLAGGDRSVRGYDEDQIRVQRNSLRHGVSPDSTRSVVNEPGLFSAVANGEVRFLALRDAGFGDVQLATFLDAALVTDTLPPYAISLTKRPTEVGVGTGVGLRYVTPVGPIALDYGVDLLHLPRGRLHLMFGYTF